MGVSWAAAATLWALSLAAAGHETATWHPSRNLTGCHIGETRRGIAGVKSYLRRYGYLPPSTGNLTDVFDDALSLAVLSYQSRLHLNRTGTLDPATLDLMAQPRCGVPDLPLSRRLLYSFFPGRPRWPRRKTHLTYSVTGGGAASREVFARAFARWAEVTPLSFNEVDGDADIRIGFFAGEHGDSEPFDGPLGTVAHAYAPPDGRLHFDADERWTDDGVDLESVAIHEIGHVLGLGHSDQPDAVMYPSIRVGKRRTELARDDVDGIQSLYGINRPGGGAAAPAPPLVYTALPEQSAGTRLTSRRSSLIALAVVIIRIIF